MSLQLQIAQESGLVEVPAAVLNETGLLGIRLTSADQPQGTQPMVGIIDCGAAFSAVNWAGAQLLGLPAKGDTAAYKASPTLYGVGVDGKPLPLFQKSVRLTFAGDAYRDSQGTPGTGLHSLPRKQVLSSCLSPPCSPLPCSIR